MNIFQKLHCLVYDHDFQFDKEESFMLQDKAIRRVVYEKCSCCGLIKETVTQYSETETENIEETIINFKKE